MPTPEALVLDVVVAALLALGRRELVGAEEEEEELLALGRRELVGADDDEELLALGRTELVGADDDLVFLVEFAVFLLPPSVAAVTAFLLKSLDSVLPRLTQTYLLPSAVPISPALAISKLPFFD